MSTTVDERVVSMQFDNKNFESNVSTTLSTLDKLKKSLKLEGVTKGLEGINTAASKVDMSGLSTGVETVGLKFNALYTIADQALRNITNSAMSAGKKIVSALTIDPLKTGFQEYETQINAVQTILANTSSKGTTIDQVNDALDELNLYADKTIYNFTEMTRNIGTFTAAGIDLETSVSAIQGIANLAAVSGSTSQQASTAMYQLSQALAAGTVKLMDWNSVVNAGMGGQIFQDALKETSELLNTGAEQAIKAKGSFRESLSTGWLTAEVLTETLKKFTTSGANEYVAKYTGLSQEAIETTLKEAEAMYGEADAIEEASKALAEKSGKNKDEIKQALQFAKTAEDAATKVKTFTQLWDVIKESVQSGWAQTWKIIFGDFEEAKALFTPLADFITGIISKISDARNKLLEGAMGSPLGKLVEKISGVTSSISEAVETVKDYEDIVNRIIKGEFGNGQSRWDKLKEAGYDWAHAQNLVNEKLGSSVRHTTDYKEAQEELNKTQSKSIDKLAEMTDEQLKSLGYSDEQIAALKELKRHAEKLGMPISELIENIDELDGRTLLINSFKNVGQSLVKIFTAIGEAWRNAFPPMTEMQLYNIIAAIHKFSTYLKISDDTANNLTRTLKGVFAVIDILASLTGGVLKIGFEIIKAVLEALGMVPADILSITATVGDAIVAFRDWFEKHNLITKGIKLLVPLIVNMGKAIWNMLKYLYDLPVVQRGVDGIKNAFSRIWDVVKGIYEPIKKFVETIGEMNSINLDKINYAFTTMVEAIRSNLMKVLKGTYFGDLLGDAGFDLLIGFVEGVRKGIGTVVKSIVELGKTILSTLMGELDEHSPSKEAETIGDNFIQGLIIGFQNGISGLLKVLGNIASSILDFFKSFDWSAIFAGLVSVGLIKIVKKFADAFEALTAPLEGVGNVLNGVGEVLEESAKGIGKTVKNFAKVVKSFSKVLNSISFNIKAKAIKDLAISLAILVGAIVILTFIDINKLWDAVKVVAAMAAILIALSFATDKLSKSAVSIDKNGAKLNGFGTTMIALAAAILLLSLAVKVIGKLDPEQAKQGFIGLAGLVAAIAVVMAAFGKFVKGKSAQNIGKLGGTMFKLSVALLLLVAAVKLISKLNPDEMKTGAVAMGAFVVFVGLLVAATNLAGKKIDKVGSFMLKLSAAMLLLVAAVKLIGGLSPEELTKGGIAMIAFTAFVAGLIKIVKKADKEVPKLGGLLLSMSAAMLIMAGVIKIIGTMSGEDILKGIIVIAAFGVIIDKLIQSVGKIGKDTPKLAMTLIGMSIAIGIMASVAVMLSLISLSGLAKGVIAVGILGAVVAGMVKATKGASDVKGTLIGISVAIGVMAVAVAALSMIEFKKLAGATVALSILMGMFALIAKAAGTMGKAMGSLIVMTVVVGLLAVVIYKLSELPIKSTLGTTAALSILLLSMSGALLILSTVGVMGGAAISGITTLGILIAGIAGVLVVLAGLNKLFPGLEEFLDTGIVLLEKLGYALGSFFGNIIGGFSAGVTSGLPEIGEHLSDFMDNAGVFIEGAKSVKSDVLEGVKVLTEAIILLAGADLVNTITSKFGGDSFATIGDQLKAFGQAMVDFSGIISGNIDEDAVTAAANAGKALAELNNSLPGTGGVFEYFTGDKSLSTFGSQLKVFGEAIAEFSTAVSGKIDESAVQAAATAGTIMAELQSKLVGTGGVVQWFTGEKDLGTFGTQLKIFGEGITEFSKTVAGNINEEAVTAAANAGSVMAELQSKLVGTGGVVQWFMGEKDFVAFGDGIVAFGKAVVAFSNTVSAEGVINENAITAAANAGTLLAKLQGELEPIGGVVDFFVGRDDLGTFGESIKSFGKAIVGFSESVSGNIDEEAVNAAVNTGKMMTELQKAIPEDKWFDGKVSLSEFGGQLKDFGKGIANYSEELEGFDSATASSALYSIEQLINILSSLQGLDTSVAISFKDAIGTLAETNISGFVEAFNVSIPNIQVLGANLINAIVTGATGAQGTLTLTMSNILNSILVSLQSYSTAFTTLGSIYIIGITLGIIQQMSLISEATKMVVSSAASSANKYYTDFYDAGVYLVDGFAEGISAETWAAEAKASAMAKAALQAAEEALGIASPSKEFYGIGEFSGLGFINALSDFTSKAYSAGAGMAESAKVGLSDTLSKIGTAVDNSDMDITPTIRPVLDMSEIQNGANQINGLFSNRTYALAGINANLDSAKIDRMSDVVNQLQQLNDTDNSDIVDAITTLRSDVNTLAQAISGMQLTLDGGAVVGGLIHKIDNSLGQIANHKGRGN